MAAVEGFDPAKSGQQPTDAGGQPVPVGVWGDSSTGVGVFGSSGLLAAGTADIPTDVAGVEGHSLDNPGVLGRSVTSSGVTGESLQNPGVLGRSQSGFGMLGVSFAAAPDGTGVFGSSTTGGDGVVGFVGDGTGVVGDSVRGNGVRGISGTANGVVGENFSQPGDPLDPLPAGVLGRSALGNGVAGESTSGSGVFGLNDGAQAGVWGSNCSNDPGIGVRGTSLAGTGTFGSSILGNGVHGDSLDANGIDGFSSRGAGVLGDSGPNGFAGVFLGRVRITGLLSKGGGGFEIDHPLDPENRYLRHSFVESPDMANVYNGTVTTDDAGEAAVELPDYFDALNHRCCYQLTVVGQFAQAIVAREVQGNRFGIRTDKPHVTVCWQVTGVRRDAWATANRIEVEQEKAAADRGRYLHPDVHDRPPTAGIHDHPARGGGLQDEVARATATLPEPLRAKVTDTVQAIRQGARIDRADLADLLRQGLRQADIRRTAPTSSRARLAQEWRDVEQLVAEVGRRAGWPGSKPGSLD